MEELRPLDTEYFFDLFTNLLNTGTELLSTDKNFANEGI